MVKKTLVTLGVLIEIISLTAIVIISLTAVDVTARYAWGTVGIVILLFGVCMVGIFLALFGEYIEQDIIKKENQKKS